MGRAAYLVERRPQFGEILALAPPRHVPEAVVAGVEPQPARDDEGDALGLDLAGRAARQGGPLPLRLGIVHDAVRELVDGGLEGLRLGHALLDHDALGLGPREEPLRAARDVLERNGVPADLRNGAHGGLVPGDAARQLFDAQGGQIPSLGLAHVEHGGQAEARKPAPDPLFGAVVARFADVVARRFRLDHDWAEDFHAMLALPHLPAELVLPGTVAGDQRRVWALHRDEQAVVGAVAVESRHDGEVAAVPSRLEDAPHALLEALHGPPDLLVALRCGLGAASCLAFCHRFRLSRMDFHDSHRTRSALRATGAHGRQTRPPPHHPSASTAHITSVRSLPQRL